jgi:site-specific recombinase XerD
VDQFLQAHVDFLGHLRGLNRSAHTLDAYGRDVAQFGRFLQEQSVSLLMGINTSHISSWLARLAEQGISGASRGRKFYALRSFFDYLVATGQLAHNPSRGLEAPQGAKKEPRVLTKTEVKALQGVAQPDPRNAAIVEVLLQTGLRVGELVALTLDDVVWAEENTVGHLHVRQGKGDKDRLVALNTRAEKALKRYLKVRPQSAHQELFLSKRKAKPLYSADVRAMLRKLYEQAGIKGATVHTLRHTFCTHHAAAGTSLLVIQRAAGHASLTTTQRYLHLVEQMMGEQLEAHAL